MDCINGVHITLRGTRRAVASDFDAGHEFHDQRRPSMASNSMKSIDGFVEGGVEREGLT